MKRTYIYLLSCLLLAACSQDNEYNEQLETMKATVYLNLQCAEISVDSRSVTPQDPMTDNPMYDLCLLHYSWEGILIKGDTKTKDLGSPELNYAWNPELTIDKSGKAETICLVANMKENHPQEWPETLAKLKEACAPIQIDGTTGLVQDKKMVMFGYYEGLITENQQIRVMMGRMANSLKFVITATCDDKTRYKVQKIEIKKPSRQTYFFPRESTDQNFTGGSITESFTTNNTIAKEDNKNEGLKKELIYYYQTGENISPSESNRTSVVITVQKMAKIWSGKWKGEGNPKTYTVELGADAPNAGENRNYSLYRNNNYTFNIQLKN